MSECHSKRQFQKTNKNVSMNLSLIFILFQYFYAVFKSLLLYFRNIFYLKVDLNGAVKGLGHTNIAMLRKGKVGGQFWAAYTKCQSKEKDALRVVLEQIDIIKRFTDAYKETFEFVTTADGILKAHKDGKIASLIGVLYIYILFIRKSTYSGVEIAAGCRRKLIRFIK